MKKLGLAFGVLVIAVLGLATAGLMNPKGQPEASVASEPSRSTAADRKDAATDAGSGMAAINKAANAKKYLFVFFWKEENDQTAAMKKVFETATKKVADRADAIAVKVTDPVEKKIVDKFELDRAPMPLVLALAPNGAVTGGFPKTFEEKDLLDAFASPCTERCVKALQDKKLVFVCVQNETTTSNDAAMRGVRDFQADEKYSEVTEVVMLNPADGKEASFLGDLKINPKATEAVTALVAPPGSVVAEFTGETKKEDIVSALQKASSGPCPGGSCGPGGCAPQK